jgi:hypothetical protein
LTKHKKEEQTKFFLMYESIMEPPIENGKRIEDMNVEIDLRVESCITCFSITAWADLLVGKCIQVQVTVNTENCT